MRSLSQLMSDIEQSTNIAIFAHKLPDTDALASAAALKKIIKNNFDDDKIIDIFFEYEEISSINNPIVKGVAYNFQRCHKYDLAIAVDTANLNLLGKFKDLYLQSPKTVNIDHHVTNENYAQNNLVFKASSACESLYNIAKILGLEISDATYSLLYSGLITDTNNLQQNTTPRTYKFITELADKQIDMESLNAHFFKNNTKNKVDLLKKALDSLKFFFEERVALMRLTKESLIDCDSTLDDTLGIVNNGINIKGVEIAILVLKQDENKYYVSLRGKNNINVANIACKLGGGGHEQAAAFQYCGELNAMYENLLKACSEELDNKEQAIKSIDNMFIDEEDNV